MKIFSMFFRQDDGATAVEYGLMIALIAVAIIVAVSFFGTATSEKLSYVATTIESAS